MTAPTQQQPGKRRARGPVLFLIEVSLGLFFVVLTAWTVSVMLSIGGGYFFWKGRAVEHALSMVQEDMEYIGAAPHSLLVGDTVQFSNGLLSAVLKPFQKLKVLAWYERAHNPLANVEPQEKRSKLFQKNITGMLHDISRTLSEWTVIGLLAAQDILLRLSVALFALPAFVLACLMGTLDGLVRRDLRRWSSGRESSFIYHHAKNHTGWALTGGFGLYLTWPLDGFNPSYMVLVFTVLVATSLSIAVGYFKKYL